MAQSDRVKCFKYQSFLDKKSSPKLLQDSGIYQCFISNEIGQNVTGISLDVRSSFSDDEEEEETFPVTTFVDPSTLAAPSKPNTTQLSPDSVMLRSVGLSAVDSCCQLQLQSAVVYCLLLSIVAIVSCWTIKLGFCKTIYYPFKNMGKDIHSVFAFNKCSVLKVE